MRIGLYGGSFDPIHRGHVAAAVFVRDARGLDEVRLLPAAQAPHKAGAVASFLDRVTMARLAIDGERGLVVSEIEAERAGPSYTFETVAELARREPHVSWELLVGADMVADMPHWYRAQELVKRVTVVGFGRPGADSDAAQRAFYAAFGGPSGASGGKKSAPDSGQKSGPARLVWVEMEPFSASSSRIRALLGAGEDASELLSPAVFTFLTSKPLYGG